MNVYKHSGIVGAMGPIYCAFGGAAVAGIVGVVYAFGINWIPLIYINLLLTLGFGFAIGYTLSCCAKLGKIRNSAIAVIFGVVFGLIGLYVAWAFDPLARIPADADIDPFIAWSPDALLRWMGQGYEEGFWSIGRGGAGSVKGIFLALVWLIEGGLIVGLAAVVAPTAINAQPFCEDCQQWADVEEDVARLALAGDNNAVLDRLLGGEFAALGELDCALSDATNYLRLDLARCPECTNSHWLSVNVVVHGVDKEGKATTQVTPLVSNLEIPAADTETVRAAGRQAAAQPTPQPPSQPEELTPVDDEPKEGDFNFS